MTESLPDTNDGACLAVFTDYQYIEPGDPEVQTPLKLSVYHVNAVGTPTAFTGSPNFSATRNKILVAIIDFTKTGVLVTSCIERTMILAGNEPPFLTVSGTNYYLKGVVSSNINFYEIYNDVIMAFLGEFLFQDESRG